MLRDVVRIRSLSSITRRRISSCIENIQTILDSKYSIINIVSYNVLTESRIQVY